MKSRRYLAPFIAASTRPALPHTRSGERGSVLMWILVCVALFAALTATANQMIRSGSTNMGQELRQVHVADILQYSDAVRRVVRGIQINGAQPTQISFQNDFTATDYENTRCNSLSCRVFHVRGGGINYQQPELSWLDGNFDTSARFREWYFAGDACVTDYPGPDDSNCAAELLMMLPFIGRELCLEINRKLGITNPGDEAPINPACYSDEPFTGSFDESHSIDHAALNGRATGCFRQNVACGGSDGYYVFYKVLIGQ